MTAAILASPCRRGPGLPARALAPLDPVPQLPALERHRHRPRRSLVEGGTGTGPATSPTSVTSAGGKPSPTIPRAEVRSNHCSSKSSAFTVTNSERRATDAPVRKQTARRDTLNWRGRQAFPPPEARRSSRVMGRTRVGATPLRRGVPPSRPCLPGCGVGETGPRERAVMRC